MFSRRASLSSVGRVSNEFAAAISRVGYRRSGCVYSSKIRDGIMVREHSAVIVMVCRPSQRKCCGYVKEVQTMLVNERCHIEVSGFVPLSVGDFPSEETDCSPEVMNSMKHRDAAEKW